MRSKIIVFTFATIMAASGASTANAGWAYQGSDKSTSVDSNFKAQVCDQEADSRTAYVSYQRGDYGSGRINDADGSSGSCYENAYRQPSGIRSHKTCEDINNAPDACGDSHKHF